MNNKLNNMINEFMKESNAKNIDELNEKFDEFIKKYNNGEIEYENTPLDDAYELLEKAKPYLKETFPQGEFELELYCDLSGEGDHSLLVNIHVDDETFNNGFMFKIHHVNRKILPLQKKLNIYSEFGLMPGVRNQC